ncbi:MAG: T9SS type A sorting domain-containing protein [Bacteroidota bacterium]
MTLDPENEIVYWSNTSSQIISRAEFDGTSFEEILGTADGINIPDVLALDKVNEKIYFHDEGFYEEVPGFNSINAIVRANLDGSNPELVADLADFNLDDAIVKAINLDLVNNHFYLTQLNSDNLSQSGIFRFNLDPSAGSISNPQKLFENEVPLPIETRIDIEAGKIYIAENGNQTQPGRIREGNLDGTGTLRLITEKQYIWHLTIDSENEYVYYHSGFPYAIRRISFDGSNDTELFPFDNILQDFEILNGPVANTTQISTNPSIRVKASTNAPNSPDFTFRGSGVLGNFMLKSEEEKFFPKIPAGAYTLRSDDLLEWTILDIAITGDKDSSSVKSLIDRFVTIDLDEDEDILVEFIYCTTDTTRIFEQTCSSLEVGIDTVKLLNVFECDSLIITTTDLIPGDTTYLTAITCDPEEVDTTSFTFLNENGCDSILTVYTQLIQEQEAVPLSLGDTLVCRNENLLMVARVDSPAFEGNWQVFEDGEWTNLINEVTDTLFLAAPIPLGDVAYRFWLATICDTVYSDSIVVSSEECERPSVLGYQIVDAIMDTTVLQIDSGATYYLKDLPELTNIEAVADLEINRVVIAMEGPINTGRTERVSPYLLFDPHTGTELEGGTYSIKTIPYYELNEAELPGNPLSTSFTIIDCDAEGPLPKANSRQSISCETDSLILQGEIIGEYVEAYWKGPEGFYSEELTPSVTLEGRYVLTAVGENACVNQDVVIVGPCLEKCELSVEKFVLVNSESDEDIRELNEGDEIDLSTDGKQLNIRADVVCGPKGESLRLKLSGAQVKSRIERYNPFALAGDHEGNYFNQFFIPGEYTLTAIPYTEPNGKGDTGDSLSISFTVISGELSEQGSFSQPGDLLAERLRLFPNPTESILYLEMLNFVEGMYTAEMYDLTGKLVLREDLIYDEVRGKRFSLNMSQLPTGMYLLQISGEDYLQRRKISVNR